jgi:hypothetical protein
LNASLSIAAFGPGMAEHRPTGTEGPSGPGDGCSDATIASEGPPASTGDPPAPLPPAPPPPAPALAPPPNPAMFPPPMPPLFPAPALPACPPPEPPAAPPVPPFPPVFEGEGSGVEGPFPPPEVQATRPTLNSKNKARVNMEVAYVYTCGPTPVNNGSEHSCVTVPPNPSHGFDEILGKLTGNRRSQPLITIE